MLNSTKEMQIAGVISLEVLWVLQNLAYSCITDIELDLLADLILGTQTLRDLFYQSLDLKRASSGNNDYD